MKVSNSIKIKFSNSSKIKYSNSNKIWQDELPITERHNKK